MILAIALALANFAGAHAQTNSEYHFRQQSVADGAKYSANDDAPILSMDCLAANGYGQWSLSSVPGTGNDAGPTAVNPGWYLLPNGIYKPSVRYDPSDVVDHGSHLSGVHGLTSGSDDYAAYNTVTGPSSTLTTSLSVPGLIVLNGNSSRLDLANSHETWSHWSHYGANNIYVTPASPSGNQPIIQAVNLYGGMTSLPMGSLDNNYFGGLDPTVDPGFTGDIGTGTTHWNSTLTSEVDAVNVTYNAEWDSIGDAGKANSFSYAHDLGTVTCGAGTGQVIRHESPRPADEMPFDTAARCGQLYNEAYAYSRNHLWQMEFDTSKYYVERCPNDFNVTFAFPMMTEAADGIGNTGQLRATYFNWLKSVLYLNTSNPEYFCRCVEAIAGELPVPNDTTPGASSRSMNIPLAVQQWLLQNTNCDTASLWRIYHHTRVTQFEQWQNDPTAFKLDTTLPSMHDLGLDTLLARHAQLSVGNLGPDYFGDVIASFGVSENPMERTTTLRMTLNKEAYIRVEVFDELGNEVFGDGSGHVFGTGESDVPIERGNAPAGAYYLRLSLGSGEVRTIKLIKR